MFNWSKKHFVFDQLPEKKIFKRRIYKIKDNNEKTVKESSYYEEVQHITISVASKKYYDFKLRQTEQTNNS